MENPPLYADVVLPLALPPLTFGVGPELAGSLRPGAGAVVRLGPRKIYQGVVWRLHSERPSFAVRPVERAAGTVLRPVQMELWEWIASYYMCTLGEVMRAALPAALKPEGFSEEEFSADVFRPRMRQWIGIHPSVGSWGELNERFERLRRAPKQYALLARIADLLSGPGEGERPFPVGKAVPREETGADGTLLGALVKKKLLVVGQREERPGDPSAFTARMPELTPAQAAAEASLDRLFGEKNVVLLHGVTGSGKTELYVRQIAEVVARGEDVLYLLPEIALTAQLIERMRRFFGDRVVPYHSRFTDRRRAELYRRVEGGGGWIVMGARSALFMPLPKIGLVVVDEEHDAGYKQADSAPRYHARDCALVLARLHGARTLLGSATPSVESWLNATTGKYGLVTLRERYGDALLPQVIVSDTLCASRRGERHAHFNRILLDRIEAALAARSQVMLFQNRRGFSPYVECGECGWVAGCPHCNVTLTYHKGERMLRCHYCGYAVPAPRLCPACGKGEPEARGFGTEKVEEELQRIFPAARIARLDRDTAASERRYRQIVADFERGETDILVGTQMIAKGFDFPRVVLVGVLNADNLLNYPDFRASERAFQLMTQVAGRAGRGRTPGEVVIQTSQPQHPVIRQVMDGDYEGMVRSQLAERRSFFYPPYCRLVAVTLRHRDKAVLWRAASRFGEVCRPVFGRRLLGPEAPPVDRVREEFIVCFTLKIEREQSFAQARGLLAGMVARLTAEPDYRNLTVVCNVDPQ